MDITRFYGNPNERPLDHIKPDGGFTGIFRTIACVGDSLSSGEFESTNAEGGKGYHDLFEYSWGQYIARAAGTKVYNFSRGGMTAKEYLEGWGEANGVWDPAKAAQAYIFALGVNDLFGLRQELGTADDIDLENPGNNRPTFAGMYGKIIQKYKEIQPKARFFLMTMPRDSANPDGNPGDRIHRDHAKLLHDIAARFDYTYVIDLFRDGPVYDAEFKYNFFLGGHMNAAGYLLTAQMTMTYIDWIIRNNPEDFAQIGFVGTPWHNNERKW
ncbi:MAG: SGNH/GDSL hydrolase family protein [Clostridia bacterium]|nr:SGNH/GDSL hydrolase family protein [Clostridia bacterium]